jgi:Fe-S oxidoreductase
VFPDYKGARYVLSDCWRDREHPEIHEAVRSLLKKMNIEVTELKRNRENADFCGTLHFETELYRDEVPSFDHISHFGRETAKKLMEEKVSQLHGMAVITACCRCYKGIIAGGGHPVHMMSLLAGSDETRIRAVEENTAEIMKKPDPRYAMKNKQ